MLKRYPRTLAPHGLRAAARSAGLVSAMALAVPSLAATVEISAITPALVAGFNAESIQDFIVKNPYEGELKFGLSAEDRQRIVQLALTAVEFRAAMVAAGPSEGGAASESDLETFNAALELGPEGPLSALWRSFFQGSIVSLGYTLAPVKRVGFYNPLVDGWLMTDWSETDEGLALVEVHSVTGDVLRGEPVAEPQLPAWTRMAEKSIVGALALAHEAATEAFRSFHPLTSRQPPPAPAFEVRDQRRIIEIRLGTMRRSLNILGRPAFQSATRAFLDSLYSGDPVRLAGLIEGGSTASVHWVNGLLTPIRSQFRPTGVLHHPQGVTVVYGVPDNGRWLLFARYKPEEADAAPVLSSLALVDLVTTEMGRADQ